MALTLALFHALGSAVSSIDFWNILARGLAMVGAISDRYFGCIWSGPGDLSTFNFLSSLATASSVIMSGSICWWISFGGMYGTSSSGSLVNTLLKKFDKISAFAAMSFVRSDFGSSGSIARSPIPLLVLDFEFIYCHIILGFFFAFLARSSSNALLS